MDNLPEFSRMLNELITQNGRSPQWLAQQLSRDTTVVEGWLEGQNIPKDPDAIAQIEQILYAFQPTAENEGNDAATTHLDKRSGGVYIEKTGDVNIEGDVIGGDQHNYYQQMGEASLTVIHRNLENIFGWRVAPPEIHQHKGKMFLWSIKYTYRSHIWFWRVTLTAVILLPLLWIFWWRPVLITQLNVRGIDMIEAGNYTRAIDTLKQAEALYPNDARTHYNLGNAYDLLRGNEDQAIQEYKTTIRLDDKFWPAYNNLARLYILTGNPNAASSILSAGLGFENEMPEREVAIFQKNEGWALLGQVGRQKCPFPPDASAQTPQQTKVDKALTKLEEAQARIQTIRKTGENVSIYLADIYRLQGCAYDALGQEEEARRAWSDSLAHATAILGSEQCTATGSLLFDCAWADGWVDEIVDRLGES